MNFRLTIFILGLTISSLSAQYRTESFQLRKGWTSIYLNVDTGLVPLDTLLADYPDIISVSQWRPGGLDPSLDNETQNPGEDEWKIWRRNRPQNSSLLIPSPHAAYLVRLKNNAPDQTLTVTGKVVAPRVQWRTDGLNLVGFPINAGTPQKLDRYLGGAGVIDENTEVVRYTSGRLQKDVNPVSLTAGLINDARRGEAFWIRSEKYMDFYGPIQARVALDDGLHYGARGAQKRLTLTNLTDETVTATLTPTPSERAPSAASDPMAPLLTLRTRDQNGAYSYEAFGANHQVTINSHDSVGLTLGIDRSSMGGSPGDQFAGLLKITDGNNYSEIYLPVTAEKTSLAGLWVGDARITQVRNQLQRFQRGPDDNYLLDGNNKRIPLDGPGNDTGFHPTAQSFNFRLIVHVDADGNATLLPRVFSGIIADDGQGNILTGLTTVESELEPNHLRSAVRISSAVFPVPRPTTDPLHVFSGTYGPGGKLETTVTIGANHPSNPFLHSYHPDHDNKDARFENTLPDGLESHRVVRRITLKFNASASPGEGPEWGTSVLSGVYEEEIEGIHKEKMNVSGLFALAKVSDVSVLQTP